MFNLRKGKRKAPLICLGKPLGVYSHSRRRTYYDGPSMFVSKIYEELTHRKEPKSTLHALNSISYFNVRGTYTGEYTQKRRTNYADITRGKHKNPYDRSVFDRTIVTKQLSDSA